MFCVVGYCFEVIEDPLVAVEVNRTYYLELPGLSGTPRRSIVQARVMLSRERGF